MRIKQKKLYGLLYLFFVMIFFSITVSAEIVTIDVKIPKETHLKSQKLIFSGDGSKFAILLQENSPTVKRDQVIYLYDFRSKNWTKPFALSEASDGDIDLLALNYDGSQLTIKMQTDLLIIDTINNKLTHRLKNVGSMTQAAFSYNNKYLAFLMNAEWEVPTDLYLLDLEAAEKESAIKKLISYSAQYNAAGPITWSKDGTKIYLIEELTWGTINSWGVLKQFAPNEGELKDLYSIGSTFTRVTNYFFSLNDQYLALIIRELDENLENSKYGLLIQKEGKFVYGTSLPGWRDKVDHVMVENISTAGWIGYDKFYWINRNNSDSTLYIFDVNEKTITEKSYDQQVYLAPSGILIKLGR